MRWDRWLYVLPLRLRSVFRAAAVERELDEELRYHIERQTELNIQSGMTPIEARHAALRAMGGVEQHKEVIRDSRRVQIVDVLRRDLRYGLRLLWRSPVFTTVAVVLLALGIGANAAIFQLLDVVGLRHLPVANPHELAEVRPDGGQAYGNYDGPNSRVTYPLWEQIRQHQRAFSGIFAWGGGRLLVGRGAHARQAHGLWVSGGFFPVLGITPARGRLLAADDDRRGCGGSAVVISHGFWQSYFGGQDSAIGSLLTILDRPFTVVGVTPASFTGLEVGQTFDVVMPTCAVALWDERLDWPDRWWLTVMGRLAPGWTIERANEHLHALSQGMLDAVMPTGYTAELLEGYRALRFDVLPAARGISRVRDASGASLLLLLGLTGLVLLITCGNLATLLLARAAAREREIAVRAAIGASRRRLVVQMLIESLLIAAAGALFATPAALVASRALVAFLSTEASPITLALEADWRLIAFVAASALATVVVFGLLPALRASIVDPVTAMRQASRGLTLDRHRARLQRGLVVAQIAVSLVLVVSGLLFVQTFRKLSAVETGFEQNGTMAISFMDLASRTLPADEKLAFQERLTNEIRAVPGVAAAAATTHVPFDGSTWSHFFRVVGGDDDRKASRFAYVSPGFLETLKVPLRAGRDFTELDTTRSRRVLLVNESFVRSHLAGVENPVGATIETLSEPRFPGTVYEIVGVVGDTRYGDLRDENCWCDTPGGPTAPIAFVPFAQHPDPYAWAPVIVRAGAQASGLTAAIARRVEQLNPGIALTFVELKAQVRERLIGERMLAWLAGAFAALAMVLVIVGLYGIIAYLAVSRRNEIGIRLSLGSTRLQIFVLVLRDNIRMLALGLALGLPLAAAVTTAAGTMLYGLTPTDVPTLAIAIGALAAAAVCSGGIPAWRAARVQPDIALRTE